MSKILIVEPRRMLRQAMALILAPDHELRFVADISAVEDHPIAEYDVVVVDVVSLREQNSLGVQEISVLQDADVPTLWIEDRDTQSAPKAGKFVIIQRPIEGKALLSAVAECLNLTPPNGETFTQQKTNAAKTQPGRKESVAGGAQVIELVDVVEEETIHGNEQQTPRKKK
jgi:DNA-binding NtrC family response regulator